MSIEGQSPWEYLDQVSGVEGGQYQDPEQRLNYQLASYTSIYGGVGLNPGHFTQTLSFDKDEVKMSVKTVSGQEVDIASPWLTTYRSREGWRFNSGEELYVIMDRQRLVRSPTDVYIPVSMRLACSKLSLMLQPKRLAVLPMEPNLPSSQLKKPTQLNPTLALDQSMSTRSSQTLTPVAHPSLPHPNTNTSTLHRTIARSLVDVISNSTLSATRKRLESSTSRHSGLSIQIPAPRLTHVPNDGSSISTSGSRTSPKPVWKRS